MSRPSMASSPARAARATFHRTTITIYTREDTSGQEIDVIASRAMDGDALCAGQSCTRVSAADLPDAAASFFGVDDSDDAPESTDVPDAAS